MDILSCFTFSHNMHARGHLFQLFKTPAYHSRHVNFFSTRVISDWSNLKSDIVENSSLNSFKSAEDKYFYDCRFMFHS